MKIIPREARRITYSTEIRNLKKLSFSEIQKDIIVGNLLGDGHLCQNWFMDDGNVVKKSGKVVGFHLNTQSFTRDENLKLLNFFRSVDIVGALEKNHGKYRIGIWRKPSRDIFLEIIKDHIIPSMKYKLG